MKNKGMYRLQSGVLCTSVLLSSQAYAAASADYSDFPQNWSKDAMEFAVKNNFITGVSEDKIAPKAALTRAQLAAILSRAMKTGAGDVSVLDNFTDADKNAWYAGSMAKAVELNILYGDGDSIYPDRPVTRQELFAILVRAFSVTGGDESTLASYNDAGSISSWAKAAISAMIAQGYASGYEDKTLRPAQQVTREEFAQLLYRMQEFYGSSAAADDKAENKEEAKADEAPKTNTKKTSGGGGSSSGVGGGGTAKSAYMNTVENTKNGDVVSSHKTADKGDTVTLTATPDNGYAIRRIIVTDSSDQKLTLTEKDGKYTFTMPSSTVTVKTTFIMDKSKDEVPNPFADVSANSYYYDAVQWAVKNGTTGGTSATTFSPDAPCSRGQIVAFLWRSKQSPMVAAENPFMDVNAADYYHDAVLWAAENGITGGTGANTFSPGVPCTRAQIVTFLYRALHK